MYVYADVSGNGTKSCRRKRNRSIKVLYSIQIKDPLIGANIVVKNVPGLGVITNIDGKFKIKVELYQRLIVSYIGFESQEILIKDKKTLTVIMQESKI